jgi:hypothetical protein
VLAGGAEIGWSRRLRHCVPTRSPSGGAQIIGRHQVAGLERRPPGTSCPRCGRRPRSAAVARQWPSGQHGRVRFSMPHRVDQALTDELPGSGSVRAAATTRDSLVGIHGALPAASASIAMSGRSWSAALSNLIHACAREGQRNCGWSRGDTALQLGLDTSVRSGVAVKPV